MLKVPLEYLPAPTVPFLALRVPLNKIFMNIHSSSVPSLLIHRPFVLIDLTVLKCGVSQPYMNVRIYASEVYNLKRLREVNEPKEKGKGRLWVLQHCCLDAYCTLTQTSSFIHLQRRCTHQAA